MDNEVAGPDQAGLSGLKSTRSRGRRRIVAALATIMTIVMGWLCLGPGPKARPIISFDNSADRVVFSPDGQILFSGGPEFESLLPPDRWAISREMAWQVPLMLRDCKDGTSLLDHSLATMKLKPQALKTPASFLALSPDGKLLIAAIGNDWRGCNFNSVRQFYARIWDAATGVEGPTLDLPSYWDQLAFADAGQTLLVNHSEGADREIISRWDTRTWQPLPEILLTEAVHQKAVFAPDGASVALVDFEGAAITVFDLPSGVRRTTLIDPVRTGMQRSYKDLQFSPDGRTLAVICSDDAVQLWDVRVSKLRLTIHPDLGAEGFERKFVCGNRHLALAVTIVKSPTWLDRLIGRFDRQFLRRLSKGGVEGRVRIFDVLTGEQVLMLNDVQSQLTNLAFSPDGRILATTGDSDIEHINQTDAYLNTLLWKIMPER